MNTETLLERLNEIQDLVSDYRNSMRAWHKVGLLKIDLFDEQIALNEKATPEMKEEKMRIDVQLDEAAQRDADAGYVEFDAPGSEEFGGRR